MNRETITLTKTEQHRAHVLARVQAGIVTAQTAAELLALSVRHIRRLLAAVRKRGLVLRFISLITYFGPPAQATA